MKVVDIKYKCPTVIIIRILITNITAFVTVIGAVSVTIIIIIHIIPATILELSYHQYYPHCLKSK